jgi:hypothetical protein
VVIVGAVGQTMRTTAGMESGWISSTVITSAPLMGPVDRVVDLVTGSSAPKMMDPQARWELPLLAGHLCV